MLIQDIDKKFPPFHEPAAKAAYLIETGKFVKCESLFQPKPPDLKWFAQPGERVDDMQHPPSVAYSCGACGSVGRISGPNATAQIVRHCLIAESVPEHLAADYNRMRADYQKKYPATKVAKPTVALDANGRPKFKDPRSAADKAFDQGAAAFYGVRSNEELQQEALIAADLAARMK